MIAALLIMGFFISVTACLRFTVWAESWLAPVASSPLEREGEIRP